MSTRENSDPASAEPMIVELFGQTVELDATRIEAPEAEIESQIAEYAAGERREFDLKVSRPEGFTGEVMAAMAEILYGETRTYGELAQELDTAPIAVGNACGRNPVPLVVPCHRVVGVNSLCGYSAGDGLALKERLLELEAGAE